MLAWVKRYRWLVIGLMAVPLLIGIGVLIERQLEGPRPLEIRLGEPLSLPFTSGGGAFLVDLEAASPSTSWGEVGQEAAILETRVDDVYSQDVVLHGGAPSLTYRLALGVIPPGQHTLTLSLRADAPNPVGATVKVDDLRLQEVSPADPSYLAITHAPILYGRALTDERENYHTDVPLLMYHEVIPEGDQTTIQYGVIWSNEDGGTASPALMARWGRTTDIEWVYRVNLDSSSEIVSEFYQGQFHLTMPFRGEKEGRHPLLQTATFNNLMSEQISSDYRFFLSPETSLPSGRAREIMMDVNPWTYRIMAEELLREGKIEEPADPFSPRVSDPRNYLYLELDKTTLAPKSVSSLVGVAFRLTLRGGGTGVYTSHHDVPDQSVLRDGSASTTVELPPGTRPDDIESIEAIVVSLTSGDFLVELNSVTKAFFLGPDFVPQDSFFTWEDRVVLTSENPAAVVYRRESR